MCISECISFSFSLSDAMKSMNSEEFLKLLSKYKFILSFENAVCKDYITEKLWRPFVVGSIPVYYGSPTVEVLLFFCCYSCTRDVMNSDLAKC